MIIIFTALIWILATEVVQRKGLTLGGPVRRTTEVAKIHIRAVKVLSYTLRNTKIYCSISFGKFLETKWDAILKFHRRFGFNIEEGQSRTTLRIDIRYDVICLRSPPREEVSRCRSVSRSAVGSSCDFMKTYAEFNLRYRYRRYYPNCQQTRHSFRSEFPSVGSVHDQGLEDYLILNLALICLQENTHT